MCINDCFFMARQQLHQTKPDKPKNPRRDPIAAGERDASVNRAAGHNYFLSDKMETGVELRGTEVKSVRTGQANLKDAYALVKNGELWLLNAHIGPYDHGNIHNHEPLRTRKLLVHREQLAKLAAIIQQKGLKAESIYIMGDSTVGSWKKQFDIAKQLGVKFVTAEPPVNMLDSIDSLAGAYGIKVAIHDHWKGVSRYWHPDSVLAAIKDHPNFGACADLGHWPKSGINPVDAVKKLSGHIIGVHLKDIAAFDNPKLKDVPVGTGVVDFPAVFAELKKQQFRGAIYIERDAEDLPSNLPSVIQTVKYYNEQVKQLQ